MQIESSDIKHAIVVLAMLKYFPQDEETRAEIGSFLARICPHLEALEYLTRQLVDAVGEWPGPAEVRRILENRYRPADAGQPAVIEPGDIDWKHFPSHTDQHALAPAPPKLLSVANAAELAALPDRPAQEIIGDVVQHFSRPWPAGKPAPAGVLHALEEELALDKAAAAPLTESQKASRIAEIESILGFTR